MKKKLSLALWLGILTAAFILLSSFGTSKQADAESKIRLVAGDDLKKAAFDILDTKCNVCHRKQNPLMVFKEKNMEKRAPRIYRAVFVDRRMPKGDDIRLTNEEAATLQKWLFTLEIF